jgi:protein-tyrosine phosphatase
MMRHVQGYTLTLVLLAAMVMPAAAMAKNLQLIEELPNGFAIHRSGKPDANDIAEFKELGITEIAVLSGNADDHELKYRDVYPELKIVYNEKQSDRIMPEPAFLDWFDGWVEKARREGRKIAFRCDCGCHRTGRLAAYYQMKWQNLSYKDAIILMDEHGRWMRQHRHLRDQVRELQERIERQRGQAGS